MKESPTDSRRGTKQIPRGTRGAAGLRVFHSGLIVEVSLRLTYNLEAKFVAESVSLRNAYSNVEDRNVSRRGGEAKKAHSYAFSKGATRLAGKRGKALCSSGLAGESATTLT